jgi:hypothetical protein
MECSWKGWKRGVVMAGKGGGDGIIREHHLQSQQRKINKTKENKIKSKHKLNNNNNK